MFKLLGTTKLLVIPYITFSVDFVECYYKAITFGKIVFPNTSISSG